MAQHMGTRGKVLLDIFDSCELFRIIIIQVLHAKWHIHSYTHALAINRAILNICIMAFR